VPEKLKEDFIWIRRIPPGATVRFWMEVGLVWAVRAPPPTASRKATAPIARRGRFPDRRKPKAMAGTAGRKKRFMTNLRWGVIEIIISPFPQDKEVLQEI
jgi:hypothetical protein